VIKRDKYTALPKHSKEKSTVQQKKKWVRRAARMSQVLECLFSKLEALSLNPTVPPPQEKKYLRREAEVKGQS
jgi:hypothetical protein